MNKAYIAEDLPGPKQDLPSLESPALSPASSAT